MARQAITTRYLGPTNSRGSRIKATAAAGSVTVPYTYDTNSDGQHAKAAKALAEKFGWTGQWVAGGAPDDRGNVYVCVELGNAPLDFNSDGFSVEDKELAKRVRDLAAKAEAEMKARIARR